MIVFGFSATSAPTCPPNYILNPNASMCIIMVPAGYNWVAQNASSKAQGETPAVFTTKESVDWINDYLKNRAPSSKICIILFWLQRISYIIIIKFIDCLIVRCYKTKEKTI